MKESEDNNIKMPKPKRTTIIDENGNEVEVDEILHMDPNYLKRNDDSRFNPSTNINDELVHDVDNNTTYKDDLDVTRNALNSAGIFNARFAANRRNQQANQNPNPDPNQNNNNNNGNNGNNDPNNNINQNLNINNLNNNNINQNLNINNNNINQNLNINNFNNNNNPNNNNVNINNNNNNNGVFQGVPEQVQPQPNPFENVQPDNNVYVNAWNPNAVVNNNNQSDPENDGSDYTEAHNKIAYMNTRKLLANLYRDTETLKNSTPADYIANKNRVAQDLDLFDKFTRTVPAINDQFGESVKEAQDKFNRKGAPGIQDFLDFNINKWHVDLNQSNTLNENNPQMNNANNQPGPNNNNQPGPNNNNNNTNNNGQPDNNDNNLDAQIAALKADQERINKQLAELEEQKRKNNMASADDDFNKRNGFYYTNKKGQKRREFYFRNASQELRDMQTKLSEENGYSTREESSDINIATKQRKEARELKYLARELGKQGKFGKQSPKFKKMMGDLEAFEEFMKEINGKTRLTADELEAYDMLSLAAYNSCADYQDYKKNQVKERKPIKGKDGKEKENIKESEKIRIDGANEIQNKLQVMREKMFGDELKKKSEEMQKKCDEEASKLEDARVELAEMPHADANNTRKALEDNIAKALFYNNAMDNLNKQGRIKMVPGKSFTGTMKALDKELNPNMEALNNIKNSDVCKSLVDQAMQKLEKGEIMSNEEIKSGQKAYEMNKGSKLRQWRLKNQNNKEPENVRKKPDDPNAGRKNPGL